MLLLALKLLLAPLLVAAATLAHRRWGPAVGGRLVGLPLTATPLLILLSLADGGHFTTRVAIADQAGDLAATAWCVTYALMSRRARPGVSFAVAGAAFALAAVAVGRVPLSVVGATTIASVVLVLVLRHWPSLPPASEVGIPAPGRRSDDLVLRMAVAAGFTFLLSESAVGVGASTAGLIGAVPLVTIVLTVATHRREGAAAANQFLHGVMSGSFSVIAFLLVLAVTLVPLGTVPAFTLALGAAVVAQVVSGSSEPSTSTAHQRRRPVEPAAVSGEPAPANLGRDGTVVAIGPVGGPGGDRCGDPSDGSVDGRRSPRRRWAHLAGRRSVATGLRVGGTTSPGGFPDAPPGLGLTR